MKRILLIHFLSLLSITLFAQLYSAKSGKISFFSKAPLENIEAYNQSVNSIFNTTTGDIVFIIPVRQFKFEKALMQEHFNEKYMESDKYPNATFKGIINETIDYSKDGEYQITAKGVLSMHGVENERIEKGLLTIKNGEIRLQTNFNVQLKNHKIVIPKLLFDNIAESVAVSLQATYAPYQKK